MLCLPTLDSGPVGARHDRVRGYFWWHAIPLRLNPSPGRRIIGQISLWVLLFLCSSERDRIRRQLSDAQLEGQHAYVVPSGGLRTHSDGQAYTNLSGDGQGMDCIWEASCVTRWAVRRGAQTRKQAPQRCGFTSPHDMVRDPRSLLSPSIA